MLNKLAFRNVKKSIRDYSVYFFTLVMGVCIFYLFNSIYAQKEIMAVIQTTNESMQLLRRVLSYTSVFVAVVLGFLIVYANRFFIRRRKKELGIYLTLGMSRSKVSLILVLESCLLALAALVVGLVLGVFGSQVMSVFTAKIFEADLTGYRFVFSPEAAIKSILYFGVIFLVVIVFNIYTVGKCRLIDLLYGGRKNETNILPKFKVSLLLFVLAVLFLGTAYYLILWNGMLKLNIWFNLSLVLGVLGTLLFYFSLAGVLLTVLQRNKRFYFRGLNMFVVRQIGNKINTNFVSVSVVCLTLLLAIGIFSSGYSVQNILSKDLQKGVPYDFSLFKTSAGENNSSMESQLPYGILHNSGIVDFAEIQTFDSDILLGDLNIDFSSLKDYGLETYPVSFVPLSQYNRVAAITGAQPLALFENEYAVVWSNQQLQPLAQQMLDSEIEISCNGQTLLPKALSELPLENSGLQIRLIVPDALLCSYTPSVTVMNILCKGEESAKQLDIALNQYLDENKDASAFTYYVSREALYAGSITTKALVSFLGIYLGFVFMIVCASILAIQQLSETADNRERYLLLKKLGTKPSVINHALFMQILCYFLFPLLLAVIHSVVGLAAANDVIRHFGGIDVSGTVFVTAVFSLAIYGVYFALTYFGSKRMVEKE